MLNDILAGQFGQNTDPYFEYVTMLLHGDGTNGGQNNTFIFSNYPSATVPGGYGVVFDGNGDYLLSGTTSVSMGTGNFTIECWVFPATSTQTGVIFDTRSGSVNTKPSISYVNSTFRYYASSADRITSAASYPEGAWYHVAAVRNSGTTTLYVNGTSVGTYSDSTDYGTITRFMISADDDGSPNAYFNGYISNARYVNTAVYTSNFTPPTAPLTAITGTQLLTCQSATFVDNSPNNLTITAYGNAAIVSTTNSSIPITRNGNTTQGSFSPYGSLWSNYFDGTGDFLSFSSNSWTQLGSGDFTIEGWVNAATFSGARMLVDARGSTSLVPWQLYFASDGGLAFYGGSSVGTIFSGSLKVSLNTWTHFAVCRSGTTLRVFINGVLGSTTTVSATLNGGTTPYIGKDFSGGNNYNGYLSNFRVVIGSALYTSAFNVPTAPLTAVTNTAILICQSNRFRDASSNNFTVTRNGDVSVQRFSPFAPTTAYDPAVVGGSAYFDGTGDYLTIADNATLELGANNFTIEAWIYLNVGGAIQTVVQKRSSGAVFGGYGLYITTSNILGFVADNNTTTPWAVDISTGTALNLQSWNHVAVTRNGSTWTTWLNGVQSATATASLTINDAATSLGIGAIANGDQPLNGYISNLRIVNGTALYTSTFTPPTAPLTAITNTVLLCNFTNGAIFDNAMMADVETVGNAQIDTSIKKYGTGSLKFDGTGDYLVSPSTPNFGLGLGDFTIEFWVYVSGTSTGQIFFDQRTAASQIVPTIYIETNTIYYFVNGASRISAGFTTTNSWVHIAVARAGTSTKMFVNGTQAGSTYTDSNNYIQNPVYVGARWDATAAVNGYIDDLRITRGVARYTTNFTPPGSAFPNT